MIDSKRIKQKRKATLFFSVETSVSNESIFIERVFNVNSLKKCTNKLENISHLFRKVFLSINLIQSNSSFNASFSAFYSLFLLSFKPLLTIYTQVNV